MQRVTLGQFLERTTTYERMSIQIDPGLRRGVLLSEILICVCMIIYKFIPDGDYLREAPIFLWTKEWLANTWDFTADNRQLILIICGLVLILALGMMVPTRLYKRAEISLHIALFVPVIFATVNIVFVFILLLPLMTNLLLWLFLAVICIGIGSLLFLVLLRIFAS